MKVEIAKVDLMMLRREVHERYLYYLSTPAAKSEEPEVRQAVESQIRILAKLVRKLNRACKKAYGHDCGAYCYPVDH